MPEAPGRAWGEDANGSATVAAPPPSTESLLDRAEALLDRPDPGGALPPSASAPPSASGLLGRRVAGNGTPSRAKPATPKAPGGTPPDSKVAGSKSSRSKGGAHSKDAPADEEPKREIPAELWAEGIDLNGDPTRTVEDNILAAGKDAAAILKELSEEAEKSKGNGSSSLMRYNEG
jgi:hypothetical protein